MGIRTAFIHQGSLKDISLFAEPQTGGGVVLYEVVRVMRGVVLFLNDHMDRLAHSALLAGLSLPVSPQVVATDIGKLVAANDALEGNIRLLFIFGKDVEYWAYFIPHHYPSALAYECGVRLGLLEAERTRPNAKIIQSSLRSKGDALIMGQQLYEVLLVNSQGYITEGSRSNFFSIRGGEVYTAPLLDVLGGITRMHVLSVCVRLGIPVHEERISLQSLDSYEAAFLTGTSPQVLPVCSIGILSMNVHHMVLRRIMEGYAHYLEEYLALFV